jgi:hypothetical protein
MPLRPCLERGCPRLVKRGRCRHHTRARALAKRLSVGRVYDDVRWHQARARALARAGGRCQAIEHGERCPAVRELHGHHDYEGGVERMLLDGVDPFDERWIVVLCGRHHSQVEAWLRRRARR